MGFWGQTEGYFEFRLNEDTRGGVAKSLVNSLYLIYIANKIILFIAATLIKALRL